MKSTNGTMPTVDNKAIIGPGSLKYQKNKPNGLEKNSLSAESIIALIKTSSEHGVTSLKFGGLELELGIKTKAAATQPVTEITEQEQKLNDEKNLVRQELESRQEQIDNMLVEDPVQAEKLIADGELVPDDDGRVESDLE